jgi:hypothetical protein
MHCEYSYPQFALKSSVVSHKPYIPPIYSNQLLLSHQVTELLNQHFAGIIVLVVLFIWDNKKEEEQLAQISRDETLSRLPLRLSTDRVVELVQLRDTARPVSVVIYAFFSW